MSFLQLFITLLLIWWTFQSYRLLSNYRRATELGVPLVYAPVSPDSPLWIALQTAFTSLFKYVPFDAWSFIRYCKLGWEFHDRFRTYASLGDVFVLVTPDRNWLYIGEAEAAYDVFCRGREFGRPVWMLSIASGPMNVNLVSMIDLALDALNVFGPNVSTAEGTDWQRQRRLTATPFNEQKSKLVWAEALRQASDMRRSWSQHQGGLKSTSDDTRTLALHVLAYAGFQKSYPFRSMTSDSTEPSTYRDSISIILKNILVIIVLPPSVFRIPFLPQRWRRIGAAVTNFKQYMQEQVAEEKALVAAGERGSGTLISNLVRASEEQGTRFGKPEFKQLSVEELLGNIFVFNFAGHDTTAISLAYSVLLLVAHREVQDWIAEELRFHLTGEDSQSWDYELCFPKLQRCLAVLLETLRLYNPLPGVPKYTGSQPRTVTVGKTTIDIPADTLVVPHLMSLHTQPRYWGDDSLTWRPSRWIITNAATASSDVGTRLGQETLFVPKRGSFIAWSEGARNCPGKKFAQVEFVATMAALFRDFCAEPVRKPNETLSVASDRVLNVVKDSNVELLLQMRNPEDASVKWFRR
ncbi:MAG: hypothetical protein Q9207_000011 [Kuettlingeria erythrocarpa]